VENSEMTPKVRVRVRLMKNCDCEKWIPQMSFSKPWKLKTVVKQEIEDTKYSKCFQLY
jgi:hypothetical protein